MGSQTQINISKGWQPDYPRWMMPEGALLRAQNVLPLDTGKYIPARAKLAYSTDAKTGTARAGQAFRDNDAAANEYLFFGTDDSLFRMELNKGLTDISKAATSYGTGGNTWSFVQYKTWIIATNYAYAPQVLKGFTAANFADLAGTPPKGKYALIHHGHLILAYVDDGTVYPKRIQWAGFDNPETWAASVITGADKNDFDEADGNITGIADVGSNFAVFFENSISLGTWSGGTFTFNFKKNAGKNVGCIAHGSIVSTIGGAYFWSNDDIYFFDGESFTSVGTGVKKTLFADINSTYYYRITSFHDADNGIIYWAYPTTASTTGDPDRILAYNYRTQVFTLIVMDVECLFQIHSGAKLMDSIDTDFPSMDAIPYDMDSSYWVGNMPNLACIDPDTDKVAILAGAALVGVVETADIRADEGIGVVKIDRLDVFVENPTDAVSIRVRYRYGKNDAASYTTSVAQGAYGFFDVRASGRFIGAEITLGEHDGLSGLEIYAKQRGTR